MGQAESREFIRYLAYACFAILALYPYFLAHLSGWKDLEKHYRYDLPFRGVTWKNRFVKFSRQWKYTWFVVIGVNSHGIYFGPRFFMYAHSPLFVPWSDVKVLDYKFKPTTLELSLDFDQFAPYVVELQFTKAPCATVIVKRSFARELAEVAGDSWPGLENSRL